MMGSSKESRKVKEYIENEKQRLKRERVSLFLCSFVVIVVVVVVVVVEFEGNFHHQF
jgi:predicted nucleic acid-binding Zn ribbon protein